MQDNCIRRLSEVQILHFHDDSFLDGSFTVGLLKSGSNGFWSVASWYCFAPRRHMFRCVVNSATSASCFVCEYCFLVLAHKVHRLVAIFDFLKQDTTKSCRLGLPSQITIVSLCGLYEINSGAVMIADLWSMNIFCSGFHSNL